MSNTDATYAVACSYLGLTARDLGEIGNFSERFARDLLAGRRPYPTDVQTKIMELRHYVALIREAMYRDIVSGDAVIYIYRTKQQLRHSPVGHIWPKSYLGPYRVAAFEVMERCVRENRQISLVFAETPAVTGDLDA